MYFFRILLASDPENSDKNSYEIIIGMNIDETHLIKYTEDQTQTLHTESTEAILDCDKAQVEASKRGSYRL